MPSAAGETIDLYAEDGSDRLFLGRAHAPGGRVRFRLDPAARRDQVITVENRGAHLLGRHKIATYTGARANGSEVCSRAETRTLGSGRPLSSTCS